ncbi:MAG: hypothetical protein MI742_16950 [Desulfobacterales bacterium]|nr:hypothetical protein [Desulfobacterales bacterium]
MGRWMVLFCVAILVTRCTEVPCFYELGTLRFSRMVTRHHSGGKYHTAIGVMKHTGEKRLAGLSVRFNYTDSKGQVRAHCTKHFGPMAPMEQVVFTCAFYCSGRGRAVPVWVGIRDPAFQ